MIKKANTDDSEKQTMFYYQNCTQRLGPQQMNYHFSISLKNKYFFCEVAKSGCSSAKKELWRQEVLDVPMPESFLNTNHNPHAPFHQHMLIKPFQLGRTKFNEFIRDPSVVKWAIVRNPFTRILSGYLDKVQRNEPMFDNIAHQVAKIRGVQRDAVEASSVSFEEYCQALAQFRRPVDFDQHWRPQYAHICADIIPYTFFAKLETLDDEAKDISRRLGLSNLSFGAGKTHATGSNEKVAQYYTDKTADIVRKVYAGDFKHFHYDLDLPV
ncbi:sulfotransferase family protein [Paracoccus rhizosphaerae]|uniref:Sulfotransferase family protein n=1 Tax=Paracoccus rhizosphaerae TaxID=1133347 RepID=A0ABV6CH48_9RHOB|nr:sulfotransferase family protein [Paracoccus rhizosphaerae]